MAEGYSDSCVGARLVRSRPTRPTPPLRSWRSQLPLARGRINDRLGSGLLGFFASTLLRRSRLLSLLGREFLLLKVEQTGVLVLVA